MMKDLRWLRVVLFALGFLGCAVAVEAHDARAAYLEITETGKERYDVLWRTPTLAGNRLPVTLQMPESCRNVVPPSQRDLNDSTIERRIIDAGNTGLEGQVIKFPGLQGTIADVLVRVSRLDGTHWTKLVRPVDASFEFTATPGLLSVARAYFVHGIEHILAGFDHLLFVFGLMLLVRNGWMLVKTVTAFTVAHSITLALAALGVVHIPGPPVEAAIALSILLLATEIVRVSRGQLSLTSQWPWVVAFCFGLLHGFGFAGALSQIGLPQKDLPLALFTFNVGVEAGQLIFVGAVLGLRALLMRIKLPKLAIRFARPVSSYAVGILAAFWFIQRLMSFSS
jgi:hydrogenase/urease accessory protein HupE